MPYNLSIPGQVTEYQLRAIEIVAGLVPEGGSIVEIGSLFGATSWCWAKSVHPSVSVYCVDPWEGNEGVRPIEIRFGIKYGLEQFKVFTRDCPNITAVKGLSPDSLSWWTEKIDLLYDDAVHSDPGFSRNLEFWERHLSQDGIFCGDDYRNRFPDVRRGVEYLSKRLNRDLIVVESFWCLLPKLEGNPIHQAARKQLLALSQEYNEKMLEMGPHASAHVDIVGVRMRLRSTIVQRGIVAWPSQPDPKGLVLEVRVYSDTKRGSLIATQTMQTKVNQLIPDIELKTTFDQIELSLMSDACCDLVVINSSGQELRIGTTVLSPSARSVPQSVYRAYGMVKRFAENLFTKGT